MKFRVKTFTPRLQTVTGPKIDDLFPNEIVSDTGKTDGAFMEVDPGDAKLGWVLQADCEPVSGGARPNVERGAFVQECIAVERTLNDLPDIAPWFVAADFLIARALFETDITNAGPRIAGSDAIGPLQVSSDEWKSFLANAGPLAANYRLGDNDHAIKQIRAAAYRMHTDAVALSKTKAGKKVGSATDPFLPSYLDLFHAYLTNSAEAAVAILDAEASDEGKAKPIDQVLKGALSADQIAGLFTVRSQFMGTAGQPKPVSAFVAATEAALTDALKKAFELVQQLAPEELQQIKQGEAPWFDFAETQLDIKEPDPRILKYFDATDFRPKPTSTQVPWCGAFAAYCLAKSGSSAAALSIPKGAAAAISWRGWGVGLPLNSPDIPRGAVVVLSPAPGTGSTGHVGFFDKFLEDGRVQLLGGNQSNAVNKKPFPARIAAIRWLDLEPANSKDQFGSQTSDTPISDRAFNLIVEFEVTSKQVYEKKYRHPEWPGESSGVTIGIGYDVGYATKKRLREDWRDVIASEMIAALEQAVGVRGTPAKPLAQQLGAAVDVSWDAAIKVHRNCVIPRWIGIVEEALENTEKLSPNRLGALVSLTYNRGPSFSRTGDRFREMNAIKEHMANADFVQIPQELRSMKRLWPNSRGLRERREREAALFESA
jgi:uncharacterized protein (TIGR02594 family)